MAETETGMEQPEVPVNIAQLDPQTLSETVTQLQDTIKVLEEKIQILSDSADIERVTLKEQGDKWVAVLESANGPQQIVVEGIQPNSFGGSVQTGKGGPPGGMTPDQLQDFKKMSLQVNALQQKNKELESKLSEAATALKVGAVKTSELEEKEEVDVHDIYKAMEDIDTSLSEKIANQRLEMQKLAGDTPKPINYDPFNYGEPYAGDIVDFQARKRIMEIKLMLQGLQANMAQMRDSVKVSPNIDLGYKVVRLDELVGATGFAKQVKEGGKSQEEALLVEQSAVRIPGKADFPRKESFKTTEETDSKWAVTDSIMQTMYRLEMELSDLQKQVQLNDIGENSKIIEDLYNCIRAVKEKQLDHKTVRRMIEDYTSSTVTTTSLKVTPSRATRSMDTGSSMDIRRKSQAEPVGFPQRSSILEAGSQSLKIEMIRTEKMVQALNKTCRDLENRILDLETRLSGRSHAAGLRYGRDDGKSHAKKESSCLSCDRTVHQERKDAGTTAKNANFNPTGTKERKTFPSEVIYNKDNASDYDKSRQVGGSKFRHETCPPIACVLDPTVPGNTQEFLLDSSYVRGQDGKFYRADKVGKVTTHPVTLEQKNAADPRPARREKEDIDQSMKKAPAAGSSDRGKDSKESQKSQESQLEAWDEKKLMGDDSHDTADAPGTSDAAP